MIEQYHDLVILLNTENLSTMTSYEQN